MAVRVVLPDGETYFTYATSAAARGVHVGIFAWNKETNTLDEVAVFRKEIFVLLEVIKDGVVVETIQGYATARGKIRRGIRKSS